MRVTQRELFVYAADLACVARHELAPPGAGRKLDPAGLHPPPRGRSPVDLDQLAVAFDGLGPGGVAFFRLLSSDRIKDTASRKFVQGHELGHLMLDHPLLPPHRIGDAAASPPTAEAVRDYEAEANAFSSELTMPYVLVRDWCRAVPVNLEVPWRIARTFGMSILAGARRFAELSPERRAAVFSAHRKVMWCTESTSFTVPIERYRFLDPGSVASALWSKGKTEEREQLVPANAWLRTSASVEIIEHATASNEFRTVLSMLWVPDPVAGPLGMAA